MTITKGLIVEDPWIGYILEGTKSWEMRSTNWTYRGWFALIRKGTGTVYGVAQLIGVGAPLTLDEMIAAYDKHRIPELQIRNGLKKWNIPWKLSGARKLTYPVAYKHKSGAGPKVILDPGASANIERQLGPSEAIEDEWERLNG